MSFKMKTLPLAAVASQMLLASSCFAGYAVPVQPPQPAPLANWYINGFGGASIARNLRDGDGDIIDMKLGYDAGGAFGYRMGPFRFEAQYTYMRNTVNNITDPTSGVSFKSLGVAFNGRYQTHAGMANIYYDFNMPTDTLGIYVGGGVGFTHIRANFNATVAAPGTGAVTLSSTAVENKFAYQLAGGFTYNVDNQFYLDLGYRYFSTRSLSRVSTRVLLNHLVNLGITYHVPA